MDVDELLFSGFTPVSVQRAVKKLKPIKMQYSRARSLWAEVSNRQVTPSLAVLHVFPFLCALSLGGTCFFVWNLRSNRIPVAVYAFGCHHADPIFCISGTLECWHANHQAWDVWWKSDLCGGIESRGPRSGGFHHQVRTIRRGFHRLKTCELMGWQGSRSWRTVCDSFCVFFFKKSWILFLCLALHPGHQ